LNVKAWAGCLLLQARDFVAAFPASPAHTFALKCAILWIGLSHISPNICITGRTHSKPCGGKADHQEKGICAPFSFPQVIHFMMREYIFKYGIVGTYKSRNAFSKT
jgi:hypothetical protein